MRNLLDTTRAGVQKQIFKFGFLVWPFDILKLANVAPGHSFHPDEQHTFRHVRRPLPNFLEAFQFKTSYLETKWCHLNNCRLAKKHACLLKPILILTSPASTGNHKKIIGAWFAAFEKPRARPLTRGRRHRDLQDSHCGCLGFNLCVSLRC